MLRAFSLVSLGLRGLLVVALLAIAPLYETAHAMGVAAGPGDSMPLRAAQDMAGQVMLADAMTHQMAASHSSHDAACRILCFGWVEAVTSARYAGQMTEIAVVLTPAPASLLDGIVPAPSGHPPKRARLV